MKHIISLFTILILFSCTKEEIKIPTDNINYYTVIEGDSFKVSRKLGFKADTVTGYEFIWEYNNSTNNSLEGKNKIIINLFLYDNDVNPYAINTLKESYNITKYDNTSSNNIYTGKCGIKVSYFNDNTLIKSYISTIDNGTVSCKNKEPQDIITFNIKLEDKVINFHNPY